MPHRLLPLFFLLPALASAQTLFPPIPPETISPPAIDATGRTIAFVATLTPAGQTGPNLYVISGSAAPRQIALPSGVTIGPDVSISPAGDRLAFVAYSGGNPRIGLATPATGVVTLLPTDVEGCIPPITHSDFSCVSNVHLTSDGSAVLYSVFRAQSLVLLNLAAGASRRLPVYWLFLTASPQRSITRSADVVFASIAPLDPAMPDFRNSSMNILRMRLDGSNLLGLGFFPPSDKAIIWYPTVSADGSAIAFLANRDPQTGQPFGTANLWTMSGSVAFRATIATDVDSDAPSLSGDGSLVAYAKRGQVHVTRTDGGGDRAVTNFQQSAAHDPVISEDGSVVVFRIGPKSSGYGAIYAMNTDGTNLRAVYAPRTLSLPNGVPQITGGFPSPGSLFSVYGTNLGPDGIAVPATFPAPAQLAGVSVFVNERPVPILAVTPWQVNAHMPQEVPPGNATIQLRFADGGATSAGTVPVWLFYPGFFSYPEDYAPQAAAFHAGTAIPADRDHPAAAGEILEVFCSGLGPTDPVVPAGRPSPLLPLARAFTPEVQIGGMRAGVLYAGLSPGSIGVYQINVVVPAGLNPGFQQISIGRFGERPIAGSTIFVR